MKRANTTIPGGTNAWRYIGNRIIQQVEANDTEKRSLKRKNKKLKQMLREHDELFFRINNEGCPEGDLETCSACGRYFTYIDNGVDYEGRRCSYPCGQSVCPRPECMKTFVPYDCGAPGCPVWEWCPKHSPPSKCEH